MYIQSESICIKLINWKKVVSLYYVSIFTTIQYWHPGSEYRNTVFTLARCSRPYREYKKKLKLYKTVRSP